MKLTGSIDTFGEGSERRLAFVSGLTAILAIPEQQMVIISVTTGSVIVELGFLRIDGAQASPTEVISRLEAAATSGQLDKFGLMALNVGQTEVFDKSSASVSTGVIVGASVGGVVAVAVLVALIWRLRRWSQSQLQAVPAKARAYAHSHSTAIEMSGVGHISCASAPTVLPANFTIIQSADLLLDASFAPKKGAFGEVCKCVWKGTPVAVKKILVADQPSNIITEWATLPKFVQEAQMMHNIHHPNCVRLYGACTAPDQAIVMEWMGGGDLSQFLDHRPLPKMHRRLSLFRQICAGLNSLHSHSPDPIIHADLKPANILLDSEQKVAKIADFGLSKIRTASYAGTHGAGTVLYCAPEMLLEECPPHRPTDVYAMGLMLWEILAGKHVWHDEDGTSLKPFQLIAKYNRLERPPLLDIPADVDEAVIALMRDCWAQDPNQRPNADELWRRISALDPNAPEHNQPLELYPDDFVPTCGTLQDCLHLALPAEVFNGLLLDMLDIDAKYRDNNTQAVVQMYGLSEVEAKCIIMYTHSQSLHVPDHPRPLDPSRPKRDNQFYFLFNKACRERDAAAMQRFQNFSFHFLSALNKLPNYIPNAEQNFYRGFGQRLEEMNDLYQNNCQICWYYTSSSTMERDVAYSNFARKTGTLMEITGLYNLKDIQALSMIPSEGELLILPNTEFKVKLALSYDQARLLNSRYATIPDNVDLVILEAAPPRALHLVELCRNPP